MITTKKIFMFSWVVFSSIFLYAYPIFTFILSLLYDSKLILYSGCIVGIGAIVVRDWIGINFFNVGEKMLK